MRIQLRGVCSVFLVALLLSVPASAQLPLTTLAGGGGAGGCPTFDVPPGGSTFFLDPLTSPAGVVVDPNGRLFVSTSSNCVFRLDADGLLRMGFIDSSPFRIGTGTPGFSDALPSFDASLALLSNPMKLALDSAGNLYIADTSNRRIRKVDLTHWTISTIAGGGSLRPVDGIRATDASFLFPTGVAVDASGNVYVSDTNSAKVFKVDANGILTKVAGSGGFTYNGDGITAISAGMIPMGITVDRSGNLFIADWSNSIVRKVTPDGLIYTAAGNPFNVTGLGDGGPAAFGGILAKPRGVAVDGNGNLFIADTEHHRIRMVDATGIITTVAGNGSPGSTEFQVNFPYDVAADDLGNIFIADTGNNQLRGVVVSQRTYGLTLSSAGAGTGALTGAGTYVVGAQVPVAATPNPGSTFAGWSGPNAAECASGTVLMDADKSCTATFGGGFVDTTPPVLSGVPQSMTVNAADDTGAVVTYVSPVASDPDDAAGPVTCAPPSGSTFPVGTTTVTCSSTDTHGNIGSASFTVTVVAPVPLVVKEPITVTDSDPITPSQILPISETITVLDDVTPTPSSMLLLTETVIVRDTPTIVVPDTTPPVLTLPATIVVDATFPGGAIVSYTASALDDVSGSVAVNCTPTSGSTFPIGTTAVSCSAGDAAGNFAFGKFNVTVLGASQMLTAAINTSLADQFRQAVNLLQNASRSVGRGNVAAVCGQMTAFVNQVNAQAGGKLTVDQASMLLALAADIKSTLGCQ